MIAIPQSVVRRIVLKAYLSSDHVTVATGKTIAVVISKNGGAFANPSAGATNATEIGNGWYYIDLSTTDTGTQGPIIIRGTGTGVDDVETYRYSVDAHNAGFDALPSAVAAATGGIPTVDANNAVKVQSGTGANQISLASGSVTVGTNSDKTGYSLSVTPPTAVQIRTEMDANSTKLANLDAAVSSRSTFAGGAVASVTAAVTVGTNNDKTGYALSASGVQAVWDALTSALSTAGSIGKLIVTNLDALVSSRSTYAGGAVASVTAPVTVGTNNDKTGYSLSVTPPTAVQIRTELDANSTKLANLDVAVSTRSTYAGTDTAGTTTLLGRLTGTRATNLDNLDAAISTRSTFAGGAVASVTAPVTVGTNNDKTGYSLTNPGPNPTGAVVADGSNSPTSFITDRTETVDGYWDDALLLLTSGVLAGQVKKISGYNGSTKTVTVGAFTSTPAAGVTFQLINR